MFVIKHMSDFQEFFSVRFVMELELIWIIMRKVKKIFFYFFYYRLTEQLLFVKFHSETKSSFFIRQKRNNCRLPDFYRQSRKFFESMLRASSNRLWFDSYLFLNQFSTNESMAAFLAWDFQYAEKAECGGCAFLQNRSTYFRDYLLFFASQSHLWFPFFGRYSKSRLMIGFFPLESW